METLCVGMYTAEQAALAMQHKYGNLKRTAEGLPDASSQLPASSSGYSQEDLKATLEAASDPNHPEYQKALNVLQTMQMLVDGEYMLPPSVEGLI